MSKLLQISVYQSTKCLEKPYLSIGLVSLHYPLLHYISASLQYYSQYHLIRIFVTPGFSLVLGGKVMHGVVVQGELIVGSIMELPA